MERSPKKKTFRRRLVLNHLISDYIKYRTPITTTSLQSKYLSYVCPATLRNDVAHLEQKGFVKRVLSPRGRIPTLAGIRSYLNNIANTVEEKHYSQGDLLRKILVSSYKDTTKALHYIMQLLAKETDQLSFVAEPEIAYGFLEKLEVFKIANNKLLFVVSLDTGIDKTVIISCDYEINEQQLKALVRYVNDRLSGLRIYDIQHKHIEEMTDNTSELNVLFNRFVKEFEEVLTEISNFFIHFEAGLSFLEQPEFDNKASLLNFLSLTQRQDLLVAYMQSRAQDRKYHVMLGQDFDKDEWSDYALVFSRYELYGIPGYLGVIAPVRMDYMKNIPIVHNMAKIITETTKKGSIVLTDKKS